MLVICCFNLINFAFIFFLGTCLGTKVPRYLVVINFCHCEVGTLHQQ